MTFKIAYYEFQSVFCVLTIETWMFLYFSTAGEFDIQKDEKTNGSD